MKTITKNLYEAMFLVDSALAGSDWDGVVQTIRNILQRAEAEIVSLRKWADRKLAYEIDHKSKGTYILCYFRADGSKIWDIERNVRLSEKIMRVLILRAENQTIEDIKEKEASAMRQEKPKDEAKQKTKEKQMTTSEEERVVTDLEEKQVAADQGAEQVDVENKDNSQQEDST